jgi:hypothetical protein
MTATLSSQVASVTASVSSTSRLVESAFITSGRFSVIRATQSRFS